MDPPKPDLVVYLQAPVETLLQRIAKRGTSYESMIDAAYLTRLNDAYARFFHEFDTAPLLIVNAASIDPVQNQADYEELVGAIRRMKKGRMYRRYQVLMTALLLALALLGALPGPARCATVLFDRARGLICTRIWNNAIRRDRRSR